MIDRTSTHQYRSRPAFRPFAALAAVAATVATLSLAVVTPAALGPSDAALLARPATHVVPATEVAILPGSIHVVALRAPVARAASPFVPAVYHPKG